jgi:hypothetical protein
MYKWLSVLQLWTKVCQNNVRGLVAEPITYPAIIYNIVLLIDSSEYSKPRLIALDQLTLAT